MKIISTSILNKEQKEELCTLWNGAYPEQLKHNSPAALDHYFNTLSDLHHLLLVDRSNEIVGWAFSFKRDGETWFAVLLVEHFQHKGYGTRLLNELKFHFQVLNGWVIDHNNDKKQNGEVYISPLSFYLKNNFVVLDNSRLSTNKISAVKIRWCG